MSDEGYNVWGVVAGVIGTVAVLLPIVVACFWVRFPRTLFPALLALMKETRKLFETALKEGLITDENEIREIRTNIWLAAASVDEYHAKVYAREGWWHDATNYWHGLSKQISTTSHELNCHRVRLAERNSRERRRLALAGLLVDVSLPDIKGDILVNHPRLNDGVKYVRQSETQDVGAVLVRDDTNPYPTVPIAIRLPAQHVEGASEEAPAPVASSDTARERIPPRLQAAVKSDAADRPTYHLISDADLQGLLSIALNSPHLRHEGREWLQQTKRRDRAVLLGFGRQLCGGGSPTPSGGSLSEDSAQGSYVTNSNLEAVLHLLRRIPVTALPQEGLAQGDHHYADTLLEAEVGSTGKDDEEGWSSGNE